MTTLTTSATDSVAEKSTEEIEALEDAEDLQIAKERLANGVAAERVSIEQARAYFAAKVQR